MCLSLDPTLQVPSSSPLNQVEHGVNLAVKCPVELVLTRFVLALSGIAFLASLSVCTQYCRWSVHSRNFIL